MSEHESWEADRGDTEVNTLAIVPDDKCNHLKCILWDMRARANLRKPFAPRPRPEYTGTAEEAMQTIPKECVIGKRRKYSHTIMRGIFQLHMHGIEVESMADMIGMPLSDIKKVMKKDTETSGREWRRVIQASYLPPVTEIIRRLAVEGNHVFGSNQKIG